MVRILCLKLFVLLNCFVSNAFADPPKNQGDSSSESATKENGSDTAPSDKQKVGTDDLGDVPVIVVNAKSTKSSKPKPKPPPIAPEALRRWWKAAGELRMGKTAYKVKEMDFNDGLCKYKLKAGVMIPVFTGLAPVSERMVGMLYVGDGDLDVSFPQRADAWAFANHMVRNAGKSWDQMQPIADQQKPYRVSVDRGLILSADPAIPKLIYDLEPIGTGVYYSSKKKLDLSKEGIVVGEELRVTDNRGDFTAKLIATNVLSDRADQLERIGIDPRAMLRQDRLMHEELGFPGNHLRVVADFRTKERFHVAAPQGAVLDNMGYDRWLTCYRDGRDEANTGFRAMAFAHGIDSDNRRHFQRFTGRPFMGVSDLDAPRPPIRMDPVEATSTIEVSPKRGGMDQEAVVETQMTIKAVGSRLQYVAMQLPTDGVIRGSWKLDVLETIDGSPLAWAGLNSDLTAINILGPQLSSVMDDQNTPGNQQVTQDLQTQQPLSLSDQLNVETIGGQESGGQSEVTAGGEGQIQMAERIDPFPNGDPLLAMQLPQTEADLAESAQAVRQMTPFTLKIIAILPEPVKKGETVTLRIKWRARWPYTNFSTVENSNGIQVSTSGTTTGMRSYIPELLPAPGGTQWNFKTTIGAPSRYTWFRTQSIAASGETTKSWQDEGLWNWIVVNGKQAVSPRVGLGRWKTSVEPPVKNFPGVRVNLFNQVASKASQFPPEIRRIIGFYNNFLPSFPGKEIEVVQDRSRTTSEALTLSSQPANSGMISIQQVSVGGIGRAGRIAKEDPHRAQTQLASQLAAQYWGQNIAPNSMRDAWIERVLSDAYAAFYLRAAYGNKVYNKRLSSLQNRIENPIENTSAWTVADAKNRNYSLTGSTSYSDVPMKNRQDYGFFVIAEMLRLRVGNQAFFSAIDSLAKERMHKRITTQQIKSRLEKRSGVNLDDFFDYWVHGGFIPKLSLTYRQDEKTGDVFGCVKSDIPFGRMEAPIRLVDQNGKRSFDVFISVVNGVGSFQAPKMSKDLKVNLDPLKLLLAYERNVKQDRGLKQCGDDQLTDN